MSPVGEMVCLCLNDGQIMSILLVYAMILYCYLCNASNDEVSTVEQLVGSMSQSAFSAFVVC